MSAGVLTRNDENACRPGTGACVPRRAHISVSRAEARRRVDLSEPVPRSTTAIFRATARVALRLGAKQADAQRSRDGHGAHSNAGFIANLPGIPTFFWGFHTDLSGSGFLPFSAPPF